MIKKLFTYYLPITLIGMFLGAALGLVVAGMAAHASSVPQHYSRPYSVIIDGGNWGTWTDHCHNIDKQAEQQKAYIFGGCAKAKYYKG
jgi:hypothetical protein